MTADPQLLDLITRETPERDPALLEGLRRRLVFDFILCAPWRRDRGERAANGVMLPVLYEITGNAASRDKPFVAEVLDVGPGITDHMGNPEAMCVSPGDVFICNLHNISYRVTERGRKLYQVRNGVVYATIDKETLAVKPVQDLILVKKNEDRALLHMRGQARLPNGELWLPSEAMSTDDVRSPAIVAEYGEVVATGPGRFRDGRWSEPPCKVGDLILYDASFSSLPVTIRGEAFTLVPAPQLVQIADEA